METPIKSSTLAIDMGNSSAKAGVFREGELISPPVRFDYADWHVADELVTNHRVRNIVYSSVANEPPQEVLDKWTTAGIRLYSLQPGSPLPFPSVYTTPETLGQDRIAAILGMRADLPTHPAPAAAPNPTTAYLIVDAGTCVTSDLVDANGLHHGGNISPGMRMRLRAMHEFTARLPLPDPLTPSGTVGDATVAALRHGAMRGLVYELEGLYHRLAATYPGLELILTGGDGEWLAEQLSVPCSYRPNLVLRGLIEITSTYVPNES
ncbi:type III pantothenate kinase [Lewinella sp. 4G2]|uniref:type III pantothenate kinase n=1 Tax=Lewinella sp. 4G2 TaxID=1803372 RepID=UPI0007B4B34D|nr:type III pantothenate kinase [Lewinella sp. 4G2]OAV42912.1 hypothetical protein A3850_016950 [Lewinella sp. 4G2]